MCELIIFASQGNKKADGGVSSITKIIDKIDKKTLVVADRETKYSEHWKGENCSVRKYPFGDYLNTNGVSRLKRIAESNHYAYRLACNAKPAVAHTNDRAAFRGCGIGVKLAGVPVINNVRDTQPRMRGIRLVKWLVELALSDRVLTLSKDMRRRWKETLGIDAFPTSMRRSFSRKMTYIYSIVDPDRFHPPDEKHEGVREELGISGAPLLAYVASFHPKKKQRAFIESTLPGIVERNPGTVIAFVGDFVPSQNDHAHACRKAVERLGLDGHIHFVGYRDDVERWYQAADLTVLASEKEGLARSMIESLACGNPVVSFDVASAREILEEHDCGRVVPQGNYHQFREAITELWENDALRMRMGKRGMATARHLFDPETVARQYEALCEEVATEG